MKPQFTNDELVVIQNRVDYPELLIDLVPINETINDVNNISNRVHEDQINSSQIWSKLAFMSQSLAKEEGYDKISSLDLLEGKFEPYPYQLKVALNVLKEKSSVALLADEVGLGKTIEVGIILKEHIIRQNIDSILIITPRALVSQWQEEMHEKFSEDFITQDDEDFDFEGTRLIMSFSKLTRNIDKILSRHWDMVVVDEAHKLANTKSKRRKAVSLISRRYMLLCTATPLSNRLTDLYSIADILRPGIFGTEKEFRKNYFQDTTGRICKAEMKGPLRSNLSKIMVRTLRKDSNIPFPKRFVHSIKVKGTNLEYELFDDTLTFMKTLVDSSSTINRSKDGKINYILLKELISLQQSLSSSPEALIKSLRNKKEKNPIYEEIIDSLIEKAKRVFTYSKVAKLLETLDKLPDSQAVIYTLRLESAHMICEVLNENYESAMVYEGRLSGFQRQNLIESFRNKKVKYIVATDAAAEGLNLQTANVIINYDLHWNPMKLEQRIGRVHRRGQNRDVHVFNIVIKNTIDDYVLKILFEKIDLFHLTVGVAEEVLSDLNEDENLEETLMDIILKHKNNKEIEDSLNELKNNFEYKKEQMMLREEFSSIVLDK